jgi:hypothetical protein
MIRKKRGMYEGEEIIALAIIVLFLTISIVLIVVYKERIFGALQYVKDGRNCGR